MITTNFDYEFCDEETIRGYDKEKEIEVVATWTGDLRKWVDPDHLCPTEVYFVNIRVSVKDITFLGEEFTEDNTELDESEIESDIEDFLHECNH